MQKTSWASCVGCEEVLQTVKEEWNILHTIRRWKAERIGHYLHMNCLLKRVIGEDKGKDISDGKTRKKTS